MTTPGRLDQRFFWERLRDDYLIYDRDRGAGCFGENYVATAVDGTVAETMCSLMNLGAALKTYSDCRKAMRDAAALAPRQTLGNAGLLADERAFR